MRNPGNVRVYLLLFPWRGALAGLQVAVGLWQRSAIAMAEASMGA